MTVRHRAIDLEQAKLGSLVYAREAQQTRLCFVVGLEMDGGETVQRGLAVLTPLDNCYFSVPYLSGPSEIVSPTALDLGTDWTIEPELDGALIIPDATETGTPYASLVYVAGGACHLVIAPPANRRGAERRYVNLDTFIYERRRPESDVVVCTKWRLHVHGLGDGNTISFTGSHKPIQEG